MFKQHWLSLTLAVSLALYVVITQTTAQKVPQHICESVFSYQREGDHWIGLVKRPNNSLGELVYVLNFKQRLTNVTGKITRFSAETTKQLSVGTFDPVVRFDGFTEELPEVLLITANAKLLCPLNEPTTTLSPDIQNITKRSTLDTPIENTTNTTVKAAQQEECGILGPSALAIGGTVIARGHYPWMAALYVDESPDINSVKLEYKCVATLISARTLLTAWHCVQGVPAYNLRVWIGRHDMFKVPEPGATIMEVSYIEVHPEVDGSLIPAVDIALLILHQKAEFSNYVRPICMWESTTDLGPEKGENAQIGGWGRDESGVTTRYPKMVNVHTLPPLDCLRQLTWAKELITSRTICASNDLHHGPCFGDSGGSLMVERNGKMFIRGIVSVSQSTGKMCDLSAPVIYCDVAQHREWIVRHKYN